MKKIDKAIMLLRSIPEERLDSVIDFLTAYTYQPKKKPDKPADIVNISDVKHSDSGED